jgi:hypothetical protein
MPSRPCGPVAARRAASHRRHARPDRLSHLRACAQCPRQGRRAHTTAGTGVATTATQCAQRPHRGHGHRARLEPPHLAKSRGRHGPRKEGRLGMPPPAIETTTTPTMIGMRTSGRMGF